MDLVIEAILSAFEAVLPKRFRWIAFILWMLCIAGYAIYYFYLT
jgi:hypothetical protein